MRHSLTENRQLTGGTITTASPQNVAATCGFFPCVAKMMLVLWHLPRLQLSVWLALEETSRTGQFLLRIISAFYALTGEGGDKELVELVFDSIEQWSYIIRTIWMAVTGTMEARLEVRFRGDSRVGEKMPAIVAYSLASSLLCFTG